MTTPLDITFATGAPRVILDPQLVEYRTEERVRRNGKTVVDVTRSSFTVCSSRPATEAEIEKWRNG
jgi:hypothetical protein